MSKYLTQIGYQNEKYLIKDKEAGEKLKEIQDGFENTLVDYATKLEVKNLFDSILFQEEKPDEISIIFPEPQIQTISPKIKILNTVYTAVDLGLPSGTLWSDKNLLANNELETGGYFMWGDINIAENAFWDTYPFTGSTDYYDRNPPSKFTKYNTDSSSVSGTGDNLTTLEDSDDAAFVKSKGIFRIPSLAQFTELVTQCSEQVITINDVRVSKFTGPNGNYIMLPWCNTQYNSTSVSDLDKYMIYPTNELWSNAANKDAEYTVIMRYFVSRNIDDDPQLVDHFANMYRCKAVPIRPVFN